MQLSGPGEPSLLPNGRGALPKVKNFLRNFFLVGQPTGTRSRRYLEPYSNCKFLVPSYPLSSAPVADLVSASITAFFLYYGYFLSCCPVFERCGISYSKFHISRRKISLNFSTTKFLIAGRLCTTMLLYYCALLPKKRVDRCLRPLDLCSGRHRPWTRTEERRIYASRQYRYIAPAQADWGSCLWSLSTAGSVGASRS